MMEGDVKDKFNITKQLVVEIDETKGTNTRTN